MTKSGAEAMLCRRSDWESVLNRAAAVVFCTCPDPDTAATIARQLVSERLAACVNRIDGIASTFRWEGKISEETESLLVIKTMSAAVSAVGQRIGELHPYELPEVIAVPIDAGSTAYIEWIAANTDVATS